VASAARNYREVLDGKPLSLDQRAVELSSTYSRGFFSGWLHGVDHQRLVDGTFSAHRGIELGTIKEVKKKTFSIETKLELKAGMGLLIVGHDEVGSKIFEAKKLGRDTEVELVQKSIALKKVLKFTSIQMSLWIKSLRKDGRVEKSKSAYPSKYLLPLKREMHFMFELWILKGVK